MILAPGNVPLALVNNERLIIWGWLCSGRALLAWFVCVWFSPVRYLVILVRLFTVRHSSVLAFMVDFDFPPSPPFILLCPGL